MRDTNGDGVLDPATDTVVGGVIGAAPAGATGQCATSPVDATGRPVLSGQLQRADGTPAPGILRVLFRTGTLPGDYTPTFELAGGTAARMTIVATTTDVPTMPGLPNTGGGGGATRNSAPSPGVLREIAAPRSPGAVRSGRERQQPGRGLHQPVETRGIRGVGARWCQCNGCR